MPPIRKKKTAAKTTKTISPFKDIGEFEKELKEFSNKFKAIVVSQSKRISDYFEMSCFNLVVKYYELAGYTLTAENLQGNQYRYKFSPSGIQSSFSYFKAVPLKDAQTYIFEIQHNLAAQSSQDPAIFTTPDITVVRADSILYRTDFYDSKKTFSYVENKDLFTFCEVKQFTLFPELLFNFIGIINELNVQIMYDSIDEPDTSHLAPSLMMSGKPSKPCSTIKQSLEKRYCINIFFDLLYSSLQTFSRINFKDIRQAGVLTPVREDDTYPF